jgi:tetratricopeptide (TPR) repeat protein
MSSDPESSASSRTSASRLSKISSLFNKRDAPSSQLVKPKPVAEENALLKKPAVKKVQVTTIRDPNAPILSPLRPSLLLGGDKIIGLSPMDSFQASLDVTLETINEARRLYRAGQIYTAEDLVVLLESGADVCKAVGNLTQAADFLNEAVFVRRKFDVGSQLEIASCLNDLGLVQLDNSMFKEALDSFDDAIAALNEIYGGVHPDVAALFGNIGVAYRGMGQFQKAVASHEKALKMMEAISGKGSLESLQQKALWGVTLKSSGDGVEGSRILRAILSVLENQATLPTSHPFMTFLEFEMNAPVVTR